MRFREWKWRAKFPLKLRTFITNIIWITLKGLLLFKINFCNNFLFLFYCFTIHKEIYIFCIKTDQKLNSKRQATNNEERKKIHADIFNSFLTYAGELFEALPDSVRMTKEQRIHLKISFDRFKDVSSGKLEGRNVTSMLHNYALSHKFTIALESEFLMPLVNPYFNQLAHFVLHIKIPFLF